MTVKKAEPSVLNISLEGRQGGEEGRNLGFNYTLGGEAWEGRPGRGRRSTPWFQLYLRREGLGGEEG